MVAPALLIGSAAFAAFSLVSAATGKKVSSHYLKKSDVAGAGLSQGMCETRTRMMYIQRDPLSPKDVINVLDENRSRIYSFERVKCKAPKKTRRWRMVTAGHRAVVGEVGIALWKSWVEFPGKPDIGFRLVKKQRKCASKYLYFRYRQGEPARYRWSRTSMALDRVTALASDPCQESKQRVAFVRKLKTPKKLELLKRKGKGSESVDYEVMYDETYLDRELFIATAFVAMMTQWRKSKKSKPITAAGGSKKNKVKFVKRQGVAKVKRAVNTGAAMTEAQASSKMRKIKLFKAAINNFLGKRPLGATNNEYLQESLALSGYQREIGPPSNMGANSGCEQPIRVGPQMTDEEYCASGYEYGTVRTHHVHDSPNRPYGSVRSNHVTRMRTGSGRRCDYEDEEDVVYASQSLNEYQQPTISYYS